MTAQEIIDRLGGIETWADVYAWFKDMDEEDTLEELNRIFPNEHNSELATSIAYGVNRYGEEGPHWQSEF